jgi:UDP-arabinose 4-epimerase
MLFRSTFRYFNVIGSDPDGRLGEAPRPELREHGRISGACFDAARGIIAGLKVLLLVFYLECSLLDQNCNLTVELFQC